MVEIADIEDRESLEAWLKDQPREVAVWIALRAAARVLPVWWDAVLTDDWAHKRDLTALPVLRSLLLSSVAAVGPTEDSNATAHAADRAAYAARAARAAADVTADATAHAAARAARAAAHAAADADRAAYAAAYAAAAAADAAADSDLVWAAIRLDVEQTAGGYVPDTLALWPDSKGPLEEQWRAIVWQVTNSEEAEGWQFWIEWYDALLDGRPMLGDAARTWEMLEEIALIDDATWDAGPEVVNPVIREIWDLYRLREEVAALCAEKEQLLAGRASAEARSHNQPPELVDTEPEMARQVEVIWAGLDAAQDELEQEVPDKHVLQRTAEEMLAALKAVAGYCAKVGDAVVMSAAKVGGGAVGTAILDHVANNGRLFQFAKDLFQYAVGG
ncbi:hypothetical protein [Roseovarius indicus]|uniref:Uncharacterized protein n=1 Tax=Roseovarius indicus TaxID=540747 RepID=A0A5P3A730_9RHOB|nr:hypothetical protein [Roseovarius indicus]QEW24493.1 hypothetical protein RIdsm_00272 [Roseovarius indicus]SFE24425.1 hypothetical protein SAMN04488031_10764 [Roseovarius indicus]